VFVLRRPSARVYSHYQFARNTMAILPRDVSFAAFVAAARRDGDPLLSGRRNLRHALRYSRYADYLEAWYASFPRERIHIYLLEAMQRDQRAFMAGLADDLGIDPSFFAGYGFPRINETIEVRSAMLQRIRRAAGRRIGSRRLKQVLRRGYERLNVRRMRQQSGDEDRRVLGELDEEFAPSNRELAELTGLDLDAWS
jgi:hypothetical protein